MFIVNVIVFYWFVGLISRGVYTRHSNHDDKINTNHDNEAHIGTMLLVVTK